MLIPFDAIKPLSITGWEEYLQQGKEFLKTATNGFEKRQEVFNPEILYNVVCMAIEKFIMAALMEKGSLPYNHTMHDLVEAMDTHLPGTLDGLQEKLLTLDAFQEICDLGTYNRTPPTMEEMPGIIGLAYELRNRICTD